MRLGRFIVFQVVLIMVLLTAGRLGVDRVLKLLFVPIFAAFRYRRCDPRLSSGDCIVYRHGGPLSLSARDKTLEKEHLRQYGRKCNLVNFAKAKGLTAYQYIVKIATLHHSGKIHVHKPSVIYIKQMGRRYNAIGIFVNASLYVLISNAN